jgi:hypothetical protein
MFVRRFDRQTRPYSQCFALARSGVVEECTGKFLNDMILISSDGLGQNASLGFSPKPALWRSKVSRGSTYDSVSSAQGKRHNCQAR